MAATGASAREFRAADTQAEDYPTVEALRYMGRLYMGRLIAERTGGRQQILEEQSLRKAEAAGVTIVRDIDGKPFEDAMATIDAEEQRDPASVALIERIRRVE